jgi:acyl-CoA dehydrogenase
MFAMLMKWMSSAGILPRLSETEREALDAGTVWIDGDLFAGRLDVERLHREPYGRLSVDEQAFLDGPVEELLARTDRYEIGRTKRVPDELMQFIKDQGFMGLAIPREYGGKQFSTLAISTILAKIGPVSSTVGTLVVIPNSLGAGELVLHYGTEAQKTHYLPRLARGQYVPCFGLTEPGAGSDAASIKAEGLVFRDGDGRVRIRLNFRKRYITLAPIADLCTIACRLRDPDNLLGRNAPNPDGDLGITCVLVHKGTPGLDSGRHHDPIGDPFYNGPLVGKDVVVGLDAIIGGPERAGQGWTMLMQQLAGGRAVSLPAGAVGTAKLTAVAAGAYSMVRQQFGIPIGRMEGVEEKVGRIAGLTYLLEASRVFACTAIDNGQQPPVISAVLKAYTTEISQQLVIDGMDVFAGAAVMQGPQNILGMAYKSAPVAITVEGANILTRTLMIFGQGATRCHPYALKVLDGVERRDVGAFRGALLGWIGHFLTGLLRAEGHFLTRGLFVRTSDVAPETRRYHQLLGWAATRFGVMTDLAMFAIGGRLKRRGKLTGRYADALAWLVLGASCLRRYEAEGRKREDLPMLQYAMEHTLGRLQDAFEGIYRNFDGPLGWWTRTLGVFELRLNPIGSAPKDAHSARAARCIQSDSAQFRRLGYGVHLPRDTSRGLGRLLEAFAVISRAHPAAERIIQAQKARRLPRGYLPAQIADEAQRAGVIDASEVALLKQALGTRLEAIEVDDFAPEAYFARIDDDGAATYDRAVNA